MKSRYNALKHGILGVAVLPDESRQECENLVQGLTESLQPVGSFEELLVEKLAMLFWRYRRLLRAEAACIERQVHSTETDPEREAMAGFLLAGESGLIEHAYLVRSEVLLVHGVDCLRKLAEAIEKEDLNWQRDRAMLKRLFGREPLQEVAISDWEERQAAEKAEPDRRHSLVKRYFELAGPQEEAEVASLQAKKEILKLLEQLIADLKSTWERWWLEGEVRRRRRRIEVLVPEGEVGERFLRYEGSFERSIDRTLAQLERLQRFRAGLPVPPPVKVEVA